MHKNFCWLIFLFIVGAITTWHTGIFSVRLYQYYQLDAIASPTKVDWAVKPLSKGRFALVAEYSFLVQGTIYHGKTILKKPLFRNLWAANNSLPRYQSQQWKIWFSANYPHHSTVQKSFPLKECFYAGVLLLLFIYFLGLGYYISLLEKAKKE